MICFFSHILCVFGGGCDAHPPDRYFLILSCFPRHADKLDKGNQEFAAASPMIVKQGTKRGVAWLAVVGESR